MRLALCCDGTWSSLPDENASGVVRTNVARLYECLDTAAPGQAAYYHPGLGTQGGPLSRIAGGLFGRGLSKSIMSAYLWLAENYREGSEIFLFGYSRGAYTVRSLAGMIGYCGLLRFTTEDEAERWHRVKVAYRRGYRARAAGRDAWAGQDYDFHHEPDAPVPIRFIGVWETVGALGIPNNFALLNLLDSPFGWAFHDTRLGRNVQTARHALALDERRASFTPTIWRNTGDRDVRQIWFTGSHADVGGGLVDDRLSNISLRWIIDESRHSGLVFSPAKCEQLATDPLGDIHDSVQGVFRRLRTRPRAVPKLAARSKDVHDSVIERKRNAPATQVPYRPTQTIAAGESVAVDVYAHLHWNETGIYLERGEYAFTASGHWADDYARIGPAGYADGVLRAGRFGYALSGLWGYAERAWRAATGNTAADFWYTRRLEHVPWLALVGVIANDNGDRNPDNDGSPHPHERFVIGAGSRRVVNEPGYLYAWANDIWARYRGNRGSVRLSITRL